MLAMRYSWQPEAFSLIGLLEHLPVPHSCRLYHPCYLFYN